MIFENKCKTLLGVFVEPWGNDYWLKPSETFHFCAVEPHEAPSFHLAYLDNNIVQIYISGTNDFLVLKDGIGLDCGHQREEPK